MLDIEKPDLWAWRRNVIDEFQSLTTEQIKGKLRERSYPFGVCFENQTRDFTVSSGIRNANAFGASAIYYLGEKHLDRRACCGVQNYSTITHLKSISDLVEATSEYTLVAVDNIPGAIPLDDYIHPERPLFVFGSEGSGLSQEMLETCKEVVCIEQRGSVRSINAACANAVVLYDFCAKYRKRAN